MEAPPAYSSHPTCNELECVEIELLDLASQLNKRSPPHISIALPDAESSALVRPFAFVAYPPSAEHLCPEEQARYYKHTPSIVELSAAERAKAEKDKAHEAWLEVRQGEYAVWALFIVGWVIAYFVFEVSKETLGAASFVAIGWLSALIIERPVASKIYDRGILRFLAVLAVVPHAIFATAFGDDANAV